MFNSKVKMIKTRLHYDYYNLLYTVSKFKNHVH